MTKKLWDGSEVADDALTEITGRGRELITGQRQTDHIAATAAFLVEKKRIALRQGFIAEGVARISAQVPAWDLLDTVKLIASFWNMLGAPNAAQLLARDIYLYVVNDALPGVDAAADAALDAIDPTAAEPFGPGNPAWPT